VDVQRLAVDGRRHAVFDERLAVADASADPAIRERRLLDSEAIKAAARQLGPGCAPAVSIKQYGIYATAPNRPEEWLFRVICGDVWFDMDAANGAIRDKLEQSQRAYRWLFNALHRLNFPLLASHQALRTGLIVALCACGFVFSVTGVLMGWRAIHRRLPNVPGRFAKHSR
jgi:hypothetical protein